MSSVDLFVRARLTFRLLTILASALLAGCVWHGVLKQHADIGWGGRAVAVAVDPTNDQFVMAASPTGGLFQSGMGGAAWGRVSELPQFGCFDLEFSPDDPNLIVVTTIEDTRVANGGGIWVSSDHGKTWTHPPTTIRTDSSGAVVPHSAFGISFVRGTRNIFVGTDDGLAISQDSGVTWTFVQPAPQEPSREIYSVLGLTNGRVLTFGPAGLWMSDNGIDGWYRDATQIPFINWHVANALAVSPFNNNDVVEGGDFQTLRYSNDGGRRWTTIDTAAYPGAFRLPLVKIAQRRDSRNSFDLYWAKENALWVKTVSVTSGGLDFSAAWKLADLGHHDPADLAFSRQNPNLVYATQDGGIAKSLDSGMTWTQVGTAANGFNAFQVQDVRVVQSPTSSGENDIYFGTVDNNLYASGDGGLTWPDVNVAGPEGGAIQAPAIKSGAPYTFVFLLVADQKRSGPLFQGYKPIDFQLGGIQINPVYFLSDNRFFTFAKSTGPGLAIWWSVDGAVTWKEVPGLRIAQDVKSLAMVSGPQSNPSLIIPFQASGVDAPLALLRIDNAFDGIDGNEAVSPVPLPTNARLGTYGFQWVEFISSFGVDPTDPNFMILPDVANNQIYITRDGGTTWTQRDDLLSVITDNGVFKFSMPNSRRPDYELADAQVSAIQFDPLNRNRILLGTAEAGIVYSSDHGTSWKKIPGSESIPNVTSFAFTQIQNPDTAYASTWGQGLWTLSLDIEQPESGPSPPPAPPPPIPGAGGPSPLRRQQWIVPGDRRQAAGRFADNGPRLSIGNARRRLSPQKVFAGDEVQLQGANWLAGRGAVFHVAIDGRILSKVLIRVGADGTFSTMLPPIEVTGRHVISVTEVDADKRTVGAALHFSAMPEDDRD